VKLDGWNATSKAGSFYAFEVSRHVLGGELLAKVTIFGAIRWERRNFTSCRCQYLHVANSRAQKFPFADKNLTTIR
jgi:hypothetical protein